MKVVYIIEQYHQIGGIERVLSSKLNALSKTNDVELWLLTLSQHQAALLYDLPQNCVQIDGGLNYHKGVSYFHPKNLLRMFKAYGVIKKQLKAIQPDVVVHCSYTPDQFFIPFCLPKSVITIKELHASAQQIQNGLKKILHNLFKAYTYLVLLNETEKNFFKHPNKVVIPNLIEHVKDSKKQNFSKQRKVVFVGRLAPVKQIEHLIAIWSMIENSFPDWVFELYGSGDEQYVSGLKTLADQQGLKRLKLMGAKQDVSEVYASAQILVLSSASECFPMVLLEAMQHNVVCVSYASPYGPEHIIQHKQTGLLVELNDQQGFANALKQLMENPRELQSLASNAEQAVKQYEAENIIPKWLTLFKSMPS